jgi:hypothetical protein
VEEIATRMAVEEAKATRIMEDQHLLEMGVVLLVVMVELVETEEMAGMLMEGMVEVCVLNG